MKKIFLLFLFFSHGALATNQLGQILSVDEFSDEWKYVSAEKDSFLASKDGRFSISAVSGKLTITDLWYEEQISYATYQKLKSTYPIKVLSKKVSAKPFFIGNGKEENPKFSVFVMVGDANSIRFYKENEKKLKEHGAHIYAVPSTDMDLYYAYSCGDEKWKGEILRGANLAKPSNCSDAIGNNLASKNFALAAMLKIKRSPFLIRHADDYGVVIDTRIFEGMTK